MTNAGGVSQAANGLLMQLVLDLKSGYLRRCESLGIKREEMEMLQRLSIEELHYLANSEVSVVSININHDNLISMLQRARLEQQRLQQIDRALALGSSIELMQTFFGLSSVDVAARRRIAGIEARAGRGNALSDEDNAEIWRLWQRSGIEKVESHDGLDVMMLAAEQLNIPLTSVWHAVKGWHRTISHRSVSQSLKPVMKNADHECHRVR
ncbi:DUF2857 domain-containing protein [Enterobacteriaceae bacterium ESL0689]|nr:DUF2857 domain-containing protein [Enterobacteriaceae bacterium ESL0689]